MIWATLILDPPGAADLEKVKLVFVAFDAQITFGTQICGCLAAGARREWLVPDGRGGYAMGTVSGLRTRRYHGLLMLSGDTLLTGEPVARRMLALAGLDAVLTLPGGTQVELATHEWASGTIAPRGHELLESWSLRDGLPVWRWRIGDTVLERTLALRPGVVAITHTLLAGGPVELHLTPLCTWRDGHGERRSGDLRLEPAADGFVIEDAYRVIGPGFAANGEWYLGVHHREEAARGLAAEEDLFRPGRFHARLRAGESAAVSAWAGDLATPPPPAESIIEAATARNRSLAARGPLHLAADAFVARTASGVDVVAGYPWFGSWSRDTMIAYEGLFLSTGRTEEGRDLLRGYAATLSDGMLANTADTGRVEFNTADGTLWFLHAVDRHLVATGDTDLAAELAGPLGDVVRHHLAGTRYGIRVDADGLLTQGADGHALTWMDAVVGGVPVTPRRGKAVELNALWINGLAALGDLHALLKRDRTELDALRARSVRSFEERFFSPHGWLYDTVDSPDGDGSRYDDASLRPNQLLAFGLPHAPLRGTDGTAVRTVARTLLTPLGPRSLAPGQPGYVGRHRGDPAARDIAYHQGTIWPWLIGPYADAARAVGLPTDGLLDGILAHINEWGVGSISETADGDAPHDATGCPFQAWSVAEVLRVSTLELHES